MTPIYLRYLLHPVLLAMLVVSGCGEMESTPTGSATFNLQWEQPDGQLGKMVGAVAPDICTDYGIQTITAKYIDGSGATKASGSWACSAHQGTVNSIPVANNYTVRVEGVLASGAIIGWRGERTGVNISANTNTPVGTVTMSYIATDTTAPTVSSTTPATGSSGISVTSTPSITFSESMAPSSINETNITLTTGGTAVSGTVSYNSTSKTATFTPTASLSTNKTYVLSVGTGAKDMAGKGLAAKYSCTFTTATASVAILKLSTQGTAAAGAIKGLEVTVTLPAGVTLKADASGVPNTGVVVLSGVAPSGASSAAKYTPTDGTTLGYLKLSIANSTGFGIGEFVTITADVASGSVPLVTQFPLSGFSVFDGYGAGLGGVSATVGLVLE